MKEAVYLVGCGLLGAFIAFVIIAVHLTWDQWKDLPRIWREEPDTYLRPWFVWIRRLFRGGPRSIDGIYTLCAHCDHFIEENWTTPGEDSMGLAKYVHLDDGEKEHDHDAEPGETRTDWYLVRPDLFQKHKDGKIGPNSVFHKTRAKT